MAMKRRDFEDCFLVLTFRDTKALWGAKASAEATNRNATKKDFIMVESFVCDGHTEMKMNDERQTSFRALFLAALERWISSEPIIVRGIRFEVSSSKFLASDHGV